MFRMLGLTQSKINTYRNYYGLFFEKVDASIISQRIFECAYIVCFSYIAFLGLGELVDFPQYPEKVYAGILLDDLRDGKIKITDTSMDMRIVHVNGYQFGLSGIRYTTIRNCIAEKCKIVNGETTSYAFDFVNS